MMIPIRNAASSFFVLALNQTSSGASKRVKSTSPAKITSPQRASLMCPSKATTVIPITTALRVMMEMAMARRLLFTVFILVVQETFSYLN